MISHFFRSVVLLALMVAGNGPVFAKNGFDLTGSLVPADKILKGGPPRDGIPSIDRPQFVSAKNAEFLGGKDRVIGIQHEGVAKAYPIKILDWHEIVNDIIASTPIVVSYCPLCGTGMVFHGADLGHFGVSGLLYNSDVLMYDRATMSLWSQIMSQAVSGPRRGDKLTALAASHTTWRDWRSRHPDTLVLSTDTGARRDYDRSPYLGYAKTPRLYFDVEFRSRAHKTKELVLGVSLHGMDKAYSFRKLERQGKADFTDTLGNEEITITWSDTEQTAAAFAADGTEIPTVIAYWFAWYAFHPDTEIF